MCHLCEIVVRRLFELFITTHWSGGNQGRLELVVSGQGGGRVAIFEHGGVVETGCVEEVVHLQVYFFVVLLHLCDSPVVGVMVFEGIIQE